MAVSTAIEVYYPSKQLMLKCTWCREPVSFYGTSKHARKCTGCLTTKLYCSSCDTDNCSKPVCGEHPTCWKQHVTGLPPHERAGHQMANPFPSLFVEAVMHSESNEQTLQRLHEKDKLARWFSVKMDEECPELWLYDRFIRLCDPGRTGNRDTENHYPTFVSFIGNTSAGKSTIVRAMLLLGLLSSSGEMSNNSVAKSLDLVREAKEGDRYMPVPRSGNIQHMTDPTTFGVHLYPDEDPATGLVGPGVGPNAPQAISSQVARFPLLFADCEGFGGGTATTSAMRLTERQEEDESAEAGKPGIIKLPIIAPCYSKDSKNGIDLFYARILYAISDVVVFVTKSDQTIKVDLIRVLEWASTAVRKSYNQQSRKTLIIVRNMERASSESEYSTETLERLYLRSFGDQKLWDDSPVLKSFVEEHNLLVRPELVIQDNDQLYDALFQKIRCCYIPDKGLHSVAPERAQEVFNHFKALRHQITIAAEEEQRLRSSEFAQYNVPTLSHILTQVFEHFRTSEDPLNFYLAARRDNPTPRNISQHIANFLRLALEHTEETTVVIVDMIVDAASLMFLLYVRRTYSESDPSALNPSDMFEHDLSPFWSSGVDMYLSEYEKCTFRFSTRDGSSVHCTVRGRSCHKNHICSLDPGTTESTKTIEIKGDFEYRRSWSDANKEEWLRNIKRKFKEMYNSVFGSRPESPPKDPKRILELRQNVHRKHNSVWNKLRSNKTCLSCLQLVSDHVLPCGHSCCPRCVQEIGQPSRSFECAFDMSACTLCGTHTHNGSHQIQLKPRCAGARVLTLDGGGIRGIVELALLRSLEKEVGLGIPIRELFDLIVGTSTGGIIALALVMSSEPTDGMIKFFDKAAHATFGRSRTFSNRMTRALLILGRYESEYSAAPLTSELSTFFGEASLFAPARSRNFQSTTRVAVTTARDEGGTECIIANYNRPLGNWTRFEREDDAEKDMKVWEAGLATSAAPFYLPPFRKQNADYIDGAVFANCPAKVAIEEVGKLWPNEGTSLDILLSLGTGHQTKKKPKIPKAIRYGVFIPILHMFERQMDTERIWAELVRSSNANVEARLHRLNPDIQGQAGDYVDINHHKELEHLLGSVDEWAKTTGAARIEQISHVLIANLFFFEPDPENLPKDGILLCGSVRCRLQHGSQAVQVLLEKKVAGFWHATVTKAEVPEIQALTNGRWRSIRDVSGGSSRPSKMVVEEGNTEKFRLNFQISPQGGSASYQVLAVQLVGSPDKIPISGFPATLEELNQRSKAEWLQ